MRLKVLVGIILFAVMLSSCGMPPPQSSPTVTVALKVAKNATIIIKTHSEVQSIMPVEPSDNQTGKKVSSGKPQLLVLANTCDADMWIITSYDGYRTVENTNELQGSYKVQDIISSWSSFGLLNQSNIC